MEKRIIAFALCIGMALGNISAVFADENPESYNMGDASCYFEYTGQEQPEVSYEEPDAEFDDIENQEDRYSVYIYKTTGGRICFSDGMILPESESFEDESLDDVRSFLPDTEILLEVIPEEGYELDDIIVSSGSLQDVRYDLQFTGSEYVFAMPEDSVTVWADFSEIPSEPGNTPESEEATPDNDEGSGEDFSSTPENPEINASTDDDEYAVRGIESESEIHTGTCGENLTWVLDEEGVLTVSGIGDMYDFADDNYEYIRTVPWEEYYDIIKEVVIEDGVTSIGTAAFNPDRTGYFEDKNTVLERVIIADSVAVIGHSAFAWCQKLEEIQLPAGITGINRNTFFDCKSLKNISLPESVEYIEDGAFFNCYDLKTIVIPNGKTQLEENGYFGGVFANCSPDLTIYSQPGSEVEQYAEKTGINFAAVMENGIFSGLGLNYSELKLKPGDSIQLIAIVVPETESNKNVLWTTSDDKVAAVDDNGLVQAIKEGSAVITATSESSGIQVTCSVVVKNPESLEKAQISGISNQVYTGKEIKPVPKVTLSGTELKPDTDYTVSYENNTGVGIAKVIIEGKDDYCGKAEKEFRILFTDITDPSLFYYDPVYWAVDEGITTGWNDGTFRPLNPCNRAASLTFLWRLGGCPASSSAARFLDMTGNDDFDSAISWAASSGITTGWDDGTFRPWNTCNRAAIVAFLWRYAGEPAAYDTGVSPFMDVPEDNAFYPAILWAVQNGIVTGWDDATFRPWNTCNRLAIVTFLYRFANPENRVDYSSNGIFSLAAPSVTATGSNNTLVLRWNAVSGANSYSVYYRKPGESWKTAATVTGTEYSIQGLKYNTTYEVTVRAFARNGANSSYEIRTCSTQIAAPVLKSVQIVNGGVKVSWAKSSGAAKYRVFRKTSTEGWAALADTTALEYTDKTVKNGTKYTYTVRCITSDGKTYTSGYDQTGKTIQYSSGHVHSWTSAQRTPAVSTSSIDTANMVNKKSVCSACGAEIIADEGTQGWNWYQIKLTYVDANKNRTVISDNSSCFGYAVSADKVVYRGGHSQALPTRLSVYDLNEKSSKDISDSVRDFRILGDKIYYTYFEYTINEQYGYSIPNDNMHVYCCDLDGSGKREICYVSADTAAAIKAYNLYMSSCRYTDTYMVIVNNQTYYKIDYVSGAMTKCAKSLWDSAGANTFFK